MLDYQAIIKSDTATRLLNVFTFEYTYSLAENSVYRFHVSVEIELSDKDIDDIICTAFEGGINYWCNRVEVGESEYYGEYASDQISRCGTLILHDREEDQTYTLTLDKFIDGFQKALENGYGEKWLAYGEFDGCNIDADGADAIIQYALFGDVIYG